MKNIDANNPNAITAFSPEAHLIFRSASHLSKRQGQSEYRELLDNVDMKKQCLPMRVDNPHE